MVRRVSFTIPSPAVQTNAAQLASQGFRDDPQQALAANLIKAGTVDRPIRTNLQGIGQLAQTLAGAFLAENRKNQRVKKEELTNKAIASALRTQIAGVKPFIDPDQPTKSAIIGDPSATLETPSQEVQVPNVLTPGQAPGSLGALQAGLRSFEETRPIANQLGLAQAIQGINVQAAGQLQTQGSLQKAQLARFNDRLKGLRQQRNILQRSNLQSDRIKLQSNLDRQRDIVREMIGTTTTTAGGSIVPNAPLVRRQLKEIGIDMDAALRGGAGSLPGLPGQQSSNRPEPTSGASPATTAVAQADAQPEQPVKPVFTNPNAPSGSPRALAAAAAQKDYTNIVALMREANKFRGRLASFEEILDSPTDSGDITGRFAGLELDVRAAASSLLNIAEQFSDNKDFRGQVASLKSIVEAGGRVSKQQALRAFTNTFALMMRNPKGPFGGLTGHTSDRDLRFLLEAVPSLQNTVAGNKLIIKHFKRWQENLTSMQEWVVNQQGADGVIPPNFTSLFEKEKARREAIRFLEPEDRQEIRDIVAGRTSPGTPRRRYNPATGQLEEISGG